MSRSQRSVIGRGVIITTTQLAARLLNLATLSVVLALVGNSQFGKFQYYLSLAATALTFGSAGVDGILTRELSLGIRHACNWLYHGLVLRMGVIVFALAILFILVWGGWLHADPLLLLGTCLLGLSENLLIVGSGWYRARQLPWADLWLSLARGLAILLAVSLFLRFLPDSLGITIGYTLGAGLVLGHTVWQWRRHLLLGARQTFSYAKLLVPWATFFALDLLGNLHGQLPVLFLGSAGRFQEVALFAVYNKFLSPATIIPASYFQAFFPEFNRRLRRGDDVRAFTRQGLLTIGLAGLGSAAVVAVVAPIVIRYLAHQPVVNWRMVAAYSAMPLLVGFSSTFDNLLAAMHKERALLWSHGAADLCLVVALVAQPGMSAVYASLALIASIVVKAGIAGSVFLSQRHALRGATVAADLVTAL